MGLLQEVGHKRRRRLRGVPRAIFAKESNEIERTVEDRLRGHEGRPILDPLCRLCQTKRKFARGSSLTDLRCVQISKRSVRVWARAPRSFRWSRPTAMDWARPG